MFTREPAGYPLCKPLAKPDRDFTFAKIAPQRKMRQLMAHHSVQLRDVPIESSLQGKNNHRFTSEAPRIEMRVCIPRQRDRDSLFRKSIGRHANERSLRIYRFKQSPDVLRADLYRSRKHDPYSSRFDRRDTLATELRTVRQSGQIEQWRNDNDARYVSREQSQ